MCEWVPGFKEQEMFPEVYQGMKKKKKEKELMMLIYLLQKQLLKSLQPTNRTDCMQVKDFHNCN